MFLLFFFFFFSSRRRHTIFDCDWSSDVCSSDLTPGLKPVAVTRAAYIPEIRRAILAGVSSRFHCFGSRARQDMPIVVKSRDALSETVVGDSPMNEIRLKPGKTANSSGL